MSERFTGLWVAVEAGVGRDPLVHQLAEALGVKVPTAVGHLTMIWGGVAEHAPSGDLNNVPEKTLEVWAAWQGKAGRFSAAFKRLFVTDCGQVRSWSEYNGRWLAKTLKERARKRR